MPIASSVFCRAAATSSRSDCGNLPSLGEVDRAELGADGKAGGHGQAELGHFGQVGALAAERVLHRRIAFGPVWGRNNKHI